MGGAVVVKLRVPTWARAIAEFIVLVVCILTILVFG